MLDGVGPATVRRVVDELNRGDSADPLRRFVTGIGKLPSSARDDATELRAALADCLTFTVVDDGRADDTPRSSTGGPALDIERLLPFCARVMARRYDNAGATTRRPRAATHRRGRRIDRAAASSPSSRSIRPTAAPTSRASRTSTTTTSSCPPSTRPRVASGKPCISSTPPTATSRSTCRCPIATGSKKSGACFYVALTRARDTLSVTWPLRYHVRRYGGDDRHNLAPLSRFIDAARTLFDEHATIVDAHDERPLHLDERVTLTDEVDTFLESLWT